MNKNSLYITIALLILVGATGLALFYAYLTKTDAESRKTKTFDPLVLDGSSGGSGGAFSNDRSSSANEEVLPLPKDGDTPGLTPAEKPTDTPVTTPKTEPEKKNPKPTLERIYDAPVAGFTVLNDGTAGTVRLTERTRGNIIDIDIATKKSARVTNTTVAGVFESYFNTDGTQVILRYLDEDDSILTLGSPITELKEQPADTTASLAETGIGSYLPINIKNIAVSGDAIAYATATEDGTTQIVISDFTGSKPKRVWKNPLSGWQLLWPQKNILVITQNASAKIPGYAYSIDTKTGVTKKLIGDTRALTLMYSSFSNSAIIGSNSDTSAPIVRIRNFTDSTERTVSTPTMPEKCVYLVATQLVCGFPKVLPSGMPDVWYRGEVTLSDTFSIIETATGSVTEIINTTNVADNGLDATHLITSLDGKRVFFIDKTSGTLWMLTFADEA